MWNIDQNFYQRSKRHPQQDFRDPLIIPNSTLPRRRESSYVKNLWIPAFAGMTLLEVTFII